MELRFGLKGKKEHTQKEVADMLGISQSYISRLEKKIITRLRKEIKKISYSANKHTRKNLHNSLKRDSQ